MSKNIVIDGHIFEDINKIQLTTDGGRTAMFVDEDNAVGSLPNAEAKEFGMQIEDTGLSWFKVGLQGSYGYGTFSSITPEMVAGHPYLILCEYQDGDEYIYEIFASENPFLVHQLDNGDWAVLADSSVVYRENWDLRVWEFYEEIPDVLPIPESFLLWTSHDIDLSEDAGGGPSGWIGYEPFPAIMINKDGEFTPVEPKYEATGEWFNRIAAAIQTKTGWQEMLTPEVMINRINQMSMFRFESSASGELL